MTQAKVGRRFGGAVVDELNSSGLVTVARFANQWMNSIN